MYTLSGEYLGILIKALQVVHIYTWYIENTPIGFLSGCDAYTVVYVYYGRFTKKWSHGETSIPYAKRMCRYMPGFDALIE